MKSFATILFLAATAAVTAIPAGDEAAALAIKRDPLFTRIVNLGKRDCEFTDPCLDTETGCRSERACFDFMSCSSSWENGAGCAAGCAVACPSNEECTCEPSK